MKLLVLFMALASVSSMAEQPSLVNKIYSYSCRFNFFEGEGVSPSNVQCLPGQHLGLYHGDYNFYLFENQRGSNLRRRGSSQLYPPVCGTTTLRYDCGGSTLKAQFALSGEQTDEFPVAVYLSYAPNTPSEVSGFAAPLDEKGNCPEGLIKIRSHMASPSSMQSPLPSQFLNINGSLTNYWIGPVEEKPLPYTVYRTPAETPCDSRGRCKSPDGETKAVASFEYQGLTPVVCGMPIKD